jgi:hypothetical protein
VLAATGSLVRELVERGFGPVRRWSRGVDLARFNPAAARAHDDLFAGPFAGPFAGMERPVFLYAGRVAVEKNIAGFLSLDLPGTKVVVGDGPQLPALRRRFPDAVFTGYRENGELAAHYAAADVFVFPSRTDTFGLVLLEALASGTPVAALPVSGPLDGVGDAPVGALDRDLRAACLRALHADRGACRAHAAGFSWEACAARFREALVPLMGAPVVGVPAEGVPVEGVPAEGVPVVGVPVVGVPVVGVPAAGVPAEGVPVEGVPAAGVPAEGVPVVGVPVEGVPAEGVPAASSAMAPELDVRRRPAVVPQAGPGGLPALGRAAGPGIAPRIAPGIAPGTALNGQGRMGNGDA